MTDPKLTHDRAEAEALAAEIIDESQSTQLDEFLTFSVTVPEYQEVNGVMMRRINLGIAGNICWPE